MSTSSPPSPPSPPGPASPGGAGDRQSAAIRRWFLEEVFQPRLRHAFFQFWFGHSLCLLAAVIISSFSLASLTSFFSLTTLATFLKPGSWFSAFLAFFSRLFSWLLTSLASFLHPSSWLYHALQAGAWAGLAWAFKCYHTLTPSVLVGWRQCFSRFALLKPAYWLSLALHAVAGGCLVRCLLGWQAGPYASLTKECHPTDESRCLNESHWFLVLSGVYTGLCAWFGFHFCHGNLLRFPSVRQSSASQLRQRIWPRVKRALVQVTLNLRWFVLVYLVFGRHLGPSLLRLDYEQWDSYVAMLWVKAHTLLMSVVVNTLVVFCADIALDMHQINQTKNLVLPPTLDDPCGLVEAMEQTKSPLLRHLAFRSFVDQASSFKEEREEFYTLSQPGGHPRNWNAVNGLCLQIIQEFIGDLNQASQAAAASSKLVQQHDDLLKARPVHSSLRFRGAAGTNLAAPADTGKDAVAVADSKSSKSKQPSHWAWLKKVLLKLKRGATASGGGAVAADINVRTVFARSQIVIWAVEGLSHLIAASVLEDSFGVVQKQLSASLSCLLNLQQTVERHKGQQPQQSLISGVGVGSSAGVAADLGLGVGAGDTAAADVQLKLELRSAVRTGLYRICTAFGAHIDSVQLQPEFRQKMEHYKQFLE